MKAFAAGLLVLALASCGEQAKPGGPATTTTPEAKGPVDAAFPQDVPVAKDLRNAHTALVACLVPSDDFRRCERRIRRNLPRPLRLSDVSRDGFLLSARSPSGTRFTIRLTDDGVLKRACDRPGVGKCDAEGSWQ